MSTSPPGGAGDARRTPEPWSVCTGSRADLLVGGRRWRGRHHLARAAARRAAGDHWRRSSKSAAFRSRSPRSFARRMVSRRSWRRGGPTDDDQFASWCASAGNQSADSKRTAVPAALEEGNTTFRGRSGTHAEQMSSPNLARSLDRGPRSPGSPAVVMIGIPRFLKIVSTPGRPDDRRRGLRPHPPQRSPAGAKGALSPEGGSVQGVATIAPSVAPLRSRWPKCAIESMVRRIEGLQEQDGAPLTTFVFFDSDALQPGAPSRQSERMREACQAKGLQGQDWGSWFALALEPSPSRAPPGTTGAAPRIPASPATFTCHSSRSSTARRTR